MTQSPAGAFVDDGHCFACGRDNEFGLKMRFNGFAGGVECDVTLPAWLQGWRGVAHGGAVSMLLDEAMAHALGHMGALGVTGTINVRFRKPIPLDVPLVVRARVIERRQRFADAQAELTDAGGTALAEATARFMIVGELPPGVRLGDPDSDHG